MIKTVEVRGLTPDDFEHRGKSHTVAVVVDGIMLAAGEVTAASFVDGGVRFTLEPFKPSTGHPPMRYVDPYEAPIELEAADADHSQR